MRIIAAYLLAVLGGNSSPGPSDIKKILSSVKIEADEKRIDELCKELQGKKIEDVIAEGKAKLATVGSVAAPAAAAPASAQAEKKEEKEEKKKESDDETPGMGGMCLFLLS